MVAASKPFIRYNSMMQSVNVEIPAGGTRRYDVVIGPGLLRELGVRVRAALGQSNVGHESPALAGGRTAGAGRAMIVADAGLPGVHIDAARDSLSHAGFQVDVEMLAPTESVKTFRSAERLLERLAVHRHERHDPIVALGGGIVGDIAGFAASIYRRGVPIIQCPTTLLSMVDASVGGKTGVNLTLEDRQSGAESLKKNLVGAFWQPALVLADVATLASLPARQVRCGLAECLKHGLIAHEADPELFAWTRAHLSLLCGRDPGLLSELIERNVRVKASFVVGDEREEAPSSQGGRALLNLGHTFAHAIETIPNLTPSNDSHDAPLHHGEAVALGLVAASATGQTMGLLRPSDAAAIRLAVEQAGLPTRVAGLPGDDAILGSMAHDKKVVGGRLRLVLPVSLGEARVVENPPHEAVIAGIRTIRG